MEYHTGQAETEQADALVRNDTAEMPDQIKKLKLEQFALTIAGCFTKRAIILLSAYN